MSLSTETEDERDSIPPQRSAASAMNHEAVAALNAQEWSWTKQLAWPTLLALLGLAAMSVDISVAQWFRAKGFPSGLNKLFQLSEVFGHGLGAAAILLTIWVLAPQLRARLPRAIGAAFLPGLAANVVKLCLARQRPHSVDRLTDIRVFDTFQGWFPFLSKGSAWQSFPSSHTAVAVGLALALSWLFPRGKWLFAGFAVLAATQRLVSSNHFLSDVLWGAALGWICAAACLPGGWLSPVFDRLEAGFIARAAR